MMIKDVKKKSIGIGIKLMVIGLVIALIGFAIGGFSLKAFKYSGRHKWYKTINYEDYYFNK